MPSTLPYRISRAHPPRTSFTQILQKPHAVLGLADLRGERLEMLGIDPAIVERDLCWCRDQLALPALQHADELGRLDERVIGSGVEPGKAASELLDREAPLLH